MTNVSGCVYFEDKTKEDLRPLAELLNKQDLEWRMFNQFVSKGKEINLPGVYMVGSVSENLNSDELVSKLREQVGLSSNIINCDLSVGAQDRVIHLKRGPLEGRYIGVRIRPEYEFYQLVLAAKELGDMFGSNNIAVRTVENDSFYELPLGCIDLVSLNQDDLDLAEIDKVVCGKYGLSLGLYSFIHFKD